MLALEIAPETRQVAHDLEVLALSFGVLIEDAVLLTDFVIVNFR